MLEAGGQPAAVGTDRWTQTSLVCPLTIEGRQLGVDLELVRELRPKPDTDEIDVVLRVEDEIITLGAEKVGTPIDIRQVESTGVEMLTAAQLLGR